MATRHNKILVDHPSWMDTLGKGDACLRSVAEDVYYAKALAERHGAPKNPKCTQLLSAAAKSLKILESSAVSSGKRCTEGDRAARKYWEAKVCARES
jgi:hypothetical protein